VYGRAKKFPVSEDADTSHPLSLYAATKKAGEVMAYTYHAAFGIRATCLRYFTVYGPWGRPDMALFKFTKNILSGKPIEVYNYGKMARDFTYIDDIVDGVVAALEKDLPWAVINLGCGRSEPLSRLIELVERRVGKRAKRKLLPMQPGDVAKSHADISLAKTLLNWQPHVTLDEGVNRFFDWYGEYYGSTSL
jgi:UDP-glucuronate 4-epimerase